MSKKLIYVAVAMFFLMLETGNLFAQDPNETDQFNETLKKAEAGDADAQSKLGIMYEKGIGTPQSYEEAIIWYTKAAEQGHIDAQTFLGWMYLNGKGVSQDYKKAIEWYTKAAERGCVDAQSTLGMMYYWGQGLPRDFKEAFKWCAMAAQKGDSVGQSILGRMYYQGQGLSQDFKEAIKWYTKAAEQGHASAQFDLGLMYSSGLCVPQDDKEAVRWYSKAAEQGHAGAQCNLGNMYWNGKGVPEDYIEAYKWLNLSAAQGIELAVKKRDILRERMSPAQIAEAQRLCKEFKPKTQEQTASDSQNPAKAEIKGNGTGFFITADGYLLTAYHVVKDAAAVQVWTDKGLSPAKVVRADVANDIALLKVDGAKFDALSVQSSRGVKVGQDVFTLGFPNIQIQGTEAKYTQGNISSLSGLGDDPRLFQISAAVQPGNSGGPLLDGDGQVVGVVVSKLDEIATAKETGSLPQNVNYALKSSFVLSFLESLPELQGKLVEPKKEELSRTQVVEKASKAVVMVVCY